MEETEEQRVARENRERMDRVADYSALRHGIRWCVNILSDLKINYGKRLGPMQEERLSQAILLLREVIRDW